MKTWKMIGMYNADCPKFLNKRLQAKKQMKLRLVWQMPLSVLFSCHSSMIHTALFPNVSSKFRKLTLCKHITIWLGFGSLLCKERYQGSVSRSYAKYIPSHKTAFPQEGMFLFWTTVPIIFYHNLWEPVGVVVRHQSKTQETEWVTFGQSLFLSHKRQARD